MADCEWAILCDYAFLDAQGKMCLIGIFNRVHARTVPTFHRQAMLIVQLAGEPGEDVRVKIEILRPTGTVLQGLEGQGTISPMGGAGIVLQLQSLQLPDWGRYRINIRLNDDLVATSGFNVETIPSPGPS